MIRKATKEDVFDLVLLVKEFTKQTDFDVKFDGEHTKSTLDTMIDNDYCFVKVITLNEDILGFLCGMATSTAISKEMTAVELGWYVTKDQRKSIESIKLMKDFEKWAKEIGCKSVSMSDVPYIRDMTTVYSRLGYGKKEQTFTKRL